MQNMNNLKYICFLWIAIGIFYSLLIFFCGQNELHEEQEEGISAQIFCR
jgi:hypothetical protein